MKVKVYQFKEEIEVPDDERVIRGKLVEDRFNRNKNMVDPLHMTRKTFNIERVGIFLERGYVHSCFAVDDDKSDTSLSYVLHKAGDTHKTLSKKAKELRKLKELNLFQRIFQWKKYVDETEASSAE